MLTLYTKTVLFISNDHIEDGFSMNQIDVKLQEAAMFLHCET